MRGKAVDVAFSVVVRHTKGTLARPRRVSLLLTS